MTLRNNDWYERDTRIAYVHGARMRRGIPLPTPACLSSLTRVAFHNAVIALAATGGSTHVEVLLLVIAGRVG